MLPIVSFVKIFGWFCPETEQEKNTRELFEGIRRRVSNQNSDLTSSSEFYDHDDEKTDYLDDDIYDTLRVDTEEEPEFLQYE